MKQCFDIVKVKLLEALSEKEYRLESDKHDGDVMSALYLSEKDSIKLEYDMKSKLFNLYRGDEEGKEDSFARTQTYLFDFENGDGIKEAAGVANEFIDTMQGSELKPLPSAAKQRKRKDKDSDESSAEFFVNRIPSVMIECREPLFKHKTHYGQVLPRQFCEEVVTVAMHDMLKKGDKKKINDFFTLLSNMYKQGDLDARSIIIQVLLNDVTNPVDKELVESILDPEVEKAWSAGRRYIGKKVKPEKMNKMAMIAQYQAETLKNKK
ncbi:MAG: hypothetical protein IJC18_00815 [Clostridia bacterium]|nr:hypothetical protein [Clostridia bacterium]